MVVVVLGATRRHGRHLFAAPPLPAPSLRQQRHPDRQPRAPRTDMTSARGPHGAAALAPAPPRAGRACPLPAAAGGAGQAAGKGWWDRRGGGVGGGRAGARARRPEPWGTASAGRGAGRQLLRRDLEGEGDGGVPMQSPLSGQGSLIPPPRHNPTATPESGQVVLHSHRSCQSSRRTVHANCNTLLSDPTFARYLRGIGINMLSSPPAFHSLCFTIQVLLWNQ